MQRHPIRTPLCERRGTTAALACVAAVCAFACRTTTESSTAAAPPVVVSRFTVARAWQLWDRGTCVGHVVWHQDANDPERGFFNVSNAEHQVLGMIDEHNRAWRYRPHQREPEWLGTGTVLEGSRMIIGASGTSELFRIALDELAPAAAASSARTIPIAPSSDVVAPRPRR